MDKILKPEIYLVSDNSMVVYYPEKIDPEINRRIGAFVNAFEITDGILDIIPTFHTVHIVFDCLKVSVKDLKEKIESVLDGVCDLSEEIDKDVVEIPVCYDPMYALDMDHVCEVNGLTREEVIEKHTSVDYLIYMIGFTPGFPYLGGMDQSIATPRKTEPREKLSAGSVGIAGNQTGIYPIDSPGGWQIIGKTPLKLFDPNNSEPVLFSAGQYIKFVSISAEEFRRLEAIS